MERWISRERVLTGLSTPGDGSIYFLKMFEEALSIFYGFGEGDDGSRDDGDTVTNSTHAGG